MILWIGLVLGADWARDSRPAMGSVVGITARVEDPAAAALAFDAAYAEIERWEALLSEWRPDSLTSRLNAGEAMWLPAPAAELLRLGKRLELATRGRYSLTFRGGSLSEREDGVWSTTGPVGLGSCLKGWLNDRAAEALQAAGLTDFAIDAAGDVLARGEAQAGLGCWPVDLAGGDGEIWARACLRDEALSSSDANQQPDHLTDARTGAPARALARVAVVAPQGALADALATAIYVSGRPSLARRFEARVLVQDRRGRARGSLTTRR